MCTAAAMYLDEQEYEMYIDNLNKDKDDQQYKRMGLDG